MASGQSRDIGHTRFAATSETELAQWLKTRGAKVVERQGRYWLEMVRGFYQGLHWMSRMTIAQAERPTPLCWGYRTALAAQSSRFSNATLPIHLMQNVNDYDMAAMTSRQRGKLRKCLKQVELVQITGPELLFDQGYPVYRSAVQRTEYGSLVSSQGYRKEVQGFFSHKPGVVVAGLIDGQLAGYLTAYSVDSTAYIENVFLHSDFIKTNISLALFYAITQACRMSEQIEELVHGLHTPEKESLCHHKEGLGFSVLHIPSRVWFLPPTEHWVRKKRPDAYYRLTGRDTHIDPGQFQRGWSSSEPQRSRQ